MPTDHQPDPTLFQFDAPRPIKGFPTLHWQGKRPFTSTQYYPAQLKETHGRPVEGWLNEIYWGDNLQVMSHLLKKYRGQVKLVYIDPPFDSKADYKRKITLRGKTVANDATSFEEKQYTDIWVNDEYLQFLYERLIVLRELLHDEGTIFVHCDYHKSHFVRSILEEIFGPNNFLNEIIWKRKQATSYAATRLGIATDTIFWFAKSNIYLYNPEYSMEDDNTKEYIKERYRHKTPDGRIYKLGDLGNPEYRPNLIYEYKGCKPPANGWAVSLERMKKMDEEDRLEFPKKIDGRLMRRQFLDEYKGQLVQNLWLDIPIVNSQAKERLDYPTQKPEALIERILKTSSNPGDLVFDCFMGSGTTQAVAMKLGRRFIGADINLGAVQTTTKRLLGVAADLREKQSQAAKTAALPKQMELAMAAEPDVEYGAGAKEEIGTYYSGFTIFNVNHYDVFRNPLEARDLLLQALEVQPYPAGSLYDGEKDGRQVKIMPVNRIATRVDLNALITGFNLREFEERSAKHPGRPVESITLVCMGHEPDLAATLKEQVPYKLDVEVVDILRDKANLEFKRDAEAEVVIENGRVVIRQFYPMNLLQKLSLMRENVEDWRELVESVMIDFNYDGAVLEPSVVDIPEGRGLVSGAYPVPEGTGAIRVKITDLLSESLETTVKS